MRFFVNGIDQGVAFVHLTGGERFFPAASVFAGSAVRFNPGPEFFFPPPVTGVTGSVGARSWRPISDLEGDESCAVGAGMGVGGAQGLQSLSVISGLSVSCLDGLQSLLAGGTGSAGSSSGLSSFSGAAGSGASNSMALMQGTIVIPRLPQNGASRAGAAAGAAASGRHLSGYTGSKAAPVLRVTGGGEHTAAPRKKVVAKKAGAPAAAKKPQSAVTNGTASSSLVLAQDSTGSGKGSESRAVRPAGLRQRALLASPSADAE